MTTSDDLPRQQSKDRPAWVIELMRVDSAEDKMLVSRVVSSVESLEHLRDNSWSLQSVSTSWSKFWRGWYYTLGLPAAVLAAIAGISAIQNNTTAAAWLAFSSALISGAIGFLRPEDRLRILETKAGRAADISDRARLFLQTGMPNSLFSDGKLQEVALPKVQTTVASLTEELAAVRQGEDPELVRERNAQIGETAVATADVEVDSATYIGASAGATGSDIKETKADSQ